MTCNSNTWYRQTNIFTKPIIIGSIKDVIGELDSGIEQRFYNLVLNMIPGSLNPSKRVNICI